MAIRIVLADDHPIVLHGLQRLFERHADFDVVSCCPNGNAALDAIRQQRPDVLVLDLKMPGFSGLDVLRTIDAEHLGCRSVLLTAAARDEDIAQALRIGAYAVVLKDSQPEELLECVRRVHQGERPMGPEKPTHHGHQASDQIAAALGASLTPREIEIVRMVAKGLRNRVIADQLAISEGTVKVHLHNIYEKLAVNGRLELVLAAQEAGLI